VATRGTKGGKTETKLGENVATSEGMRRSTRMKKSNSKLAYLCWSDSELNSESERVKGRQ